MSWGTDALSAWRPQCLMTSVPDDLSACLALHSLANCVCRACNARLLLLLLPPLLLLLVPRDVVFVPTAIVVCTLREDCGGITCVCVCAVAAAVRAFAARVQSRDCEPVG